MAQKQSNLLATEAIGPNTPEQETLFAELLLPVPMANSYTYRVPRHLAAGLQVGCRVVCHFGKKRILTGLVLRIANLPPVEYEARPLLDVLELEPSVTAQQLKLFKWMADYYSCKMGEAAFAALPSGLKLSSESRIQINPDADLAAITLTDDERTVIDLILQHESMGFDEIVLRAETDEITLVLKRLIAKKAILTYEEVREKYTPRRVRMIALAPEYVDDEVAFAAALERQKRAPKRAEALAAFITQIPYAETSFGWVEKSILSKLGIGSAAIKALVEQGIFIEEEHSRNRIGQEPTASKPLSPLSPLQQQAADAIEGYFVAKEGKKDIVLLHGITGSGKTEVYMHLIAKVIEGGGQALFLLPEIALTTQIVGRMRAVFGDKMGVYHSRFSDNERVEVWKGLQEGRFSFIVGVRSAVMLPFDSLELIVVDEEHESTYKQAEPSPRYNGRDTAIMLAKLHGAKIILGSATPSIESYYMANTGRWGLVEMLERFGTALPPIIEMVDMKEVRKRKTGKGEFSPDLIRQSEEALLAGEQVILFQNRRGYAPYLSCRDCAWVPHCENCDVSLTYHQHARQLRCHYCGHTEHLPQVCRACGSPQVRPIGFGTEKLEEETQALLPEAKIVRMDQDTTRRKYALQEIITAFEKGEANVLIGTQMISKGLDFEHVSLVGIFDVDRLMHFPDFRSHERTFQMVTQVAGRAGRRQKQGTVLIQTTMPEHPVLRQVQTHDYKGFFDNEIAEREKYGYPPFTRLIKIIIKHEEREQMLEPAAWLAKRIAASIGPEKVLGPQAPLIERVRNLYIQEIFLKLPREGTNFGWVKFVIADALAAMPRYRGAREMRIIVDVDPV